MYVFRRGDVHELQFDVLDSAGKPVDLTFADVSVKVRRLGRAAVALAVTKDPIVKGRVIHMLDGTLPLGSYYAQLKIVQDGTVTRAPSGRPETTFRIEEAI